MVVHVRVDCLRSIGGHGLGSPCLPTRLIPSESMGVSFLNHLTSSEVGSRWTDRAQCCICMRKWEGSI
jgi:hypothetical protein